MATLLRRRLGKVVSVGPFSGPVASTRDPVRTPPNWQAQVAHAIATGQPVPGQPGLAFHPYTPTAPSPGYYDPSLDTNLAATHRGYGDLQQDTATQRARDTTDYLTSLGQLLTGQSRGQQDLGTATGRENEDYQRSLGALQRNYALLAGNQRQEAQAAGVQLGGTALQAARKRAANEAVDQSGLDLAHQRALADLGLQGSRLGEDSQTQIDKLNLLSAPPSAENPLGGRAFQDLTTQLQRAGREDQQANIDTAIVKSAQAKAAGAFLPDMPKNEFIGPDGKHYQTHMIGSTMITVDENGNIVSQKRKR